MFDKVLDSLAASMGLKGVALGPATGSVRARVAWPASASSRRDRGFRLGLACALALHGMLLVGLLKSPQRQIGEPDGQLDGVSVDLIEESALQSQMPGPTALPSHTLTDPVPETPPVEQPAPPQQRQSAPKSTDTASLAKEMPELFALPDPAGRQSGPDRSAKDAAKDKSKPLAGFDLTVPRKLLDQQMTFQGGSAAVVRPTDVTKSGENDDFGRGVIRALRQTLPRPNGSTGRVGIRFQLSPTGNIIEIHVAVSSGNPSMDQAVVFAARQASFPVPPRNATLSDRSFLVTYIYR